MAHGEEERVDGRVQKAPLLGLPAEKRNFVSQLADAHKREPEIRFLGAKLGVSPYQGSSDEPGKKRAYSRIGYSGPNHVAWYYDMLAVDGKNDLIRKLPKHAHKRD